MKLVLALLITVSFAAAQPNSSSSLTAPGCGPATARFEVKTTDQPPSPQMEPGKALVYFVQDDSTFDTRPRPTTRFAVDGNWMGATHSNSYLYISLDPGEHHLCASWQGSYESWGSGYYAGALHFTAEAGKTYYFSARNFAGRYNTPSVDFRPLDSDEFQLILPRLELSVSRPKP